MTRLSALLFGLKIQLKSLWGKKCNDEWPKKSLFFFCCVTEKKQNTGTLRGLLSELNGEQPTIMQIHNGIYLERHTLPEFNRRRAHFAMIRRFVRH